MSQRTYLMCSPRYFDVSYEINAWMDTSVPVDQERAIKQWEALKSAYMQAGHTVHELAPVEGLNDMVFAANGAFSVDGKVYGASFKYAQRADEARHHRDWYERNNWGLFTPPTHINEGEGDFTYVPGKALILAGYGFRTSIEAHAEAQDILQRPVISLHLVDERFYHLDVALFVLDDSNVCYFPAAFSEGSREVLEQLFPNALIAGEEDALSFGLNAVSDGENVFLPLESSGLAKAVVERGFNAIPIDLSELLKGGGSVKCCTAELRL